MRRPRCKLHYLSEGGVGRPNRGVHFVRHDPSLREKPTLHALFISTLASYKRHLSHFNQYNTKLHANSPANGGN